MVGAINLLSKPFFKFNTTNHSIFRNRGAKDAAQDETHGILEGISSLHSWIKTQTMIRYSQLYTLHHVTIKTHHDQVQSAVHTTSCYCTWYSSLHSWIKDSDHDQVQSTVHTASCYCIWFSSLHSWIKTQTMIRYSQLYTLHHVTEFDFHPFNPGSRPRPWSGTVSSTHYIMLLYLIFIPSFMNQDTDHAQVQSTVHTTSCDCTWFSSRHSWIKTQTMIRYSQLYTVHHVTVLYFHLSTHGSRPRPWSGTVNCTHYTMLLYFIFIFSLLDQDPDHDQVQSTVHTTSCYCTGFSSPSLLYQDPDHDQVESTVHTTSCYCTWFSSFTPGSRPRPWSEQLTVHTTSCECNTVTGNGNTLNNRLWQN